MTLDNLTTNGSEFTLPDGSRYSGSYHIHVSQGAMVGAKHAPTPHQRLFAVNSAVAERVASIQKQLQGQQSSRNKIQSTRSTIRASSRTPSSRGSRAGGGGGY
jgi:hypothetical protein